MYFAGKNSADFATEADYQLFVAKIAASRMIASSGGCGLCGKCNRCKIVEMLRKEQPKERNRGKS